MMIQGKQEKRLSIRLPKELHSQFKAAVATNGKTMTRVILDFVADYVRYPTRISTDVDELFTEEKGEYVNEKHPQ